MQLVMLAAIMVAAIIVSTGMGYIDVPAGAVVKIIFAKLSGQLEYLEAMDSVFPVVVVDVRLPRILSAAIVGGGLAISGVVFQGILLNPLADPYTLGVSAGAAFGASVAILLNVGFLGLYSVPLFAFGGGGRNAAVRNLSFLFQRRVFFEQPDSVGYHCGGDFIGRDQLAEIYCG